MPQNVYNCNNSCAVECDCVICANPCCWKVHCNACGCSLCILCSRNVETCPFCREMLHVSLCKHAKPKQNFIKYNNHTFAPKNFCALFCQFIDFMRYSKLYKALQMARSRNILLISTHWRTLLRMHKLAKSTGMRVGWYPSEFCANIMLMHILDVRTGVYCNFNSNVHVILVDILELTEAWYECKSLAAGRELHTIAYDVE